MAARPGDWSALGRGSDPTPGDPATLTAIADAMRDLADSAGVVNNGLRELQNTAGDGQRFIGKTADALRDVVDEHLHRFVGRVEESFRIAEGALRTYATAVTNAQAEADQALSAAQGLAEDDPARETMKERAESAASDVSTAAKNLRDALHHAGTLMVQPVSDCDLFWEVFQWLTIIISVIAVFTGGILGILAWGMNAALLIKTIVDFSQGKASGLELGLAFLGVLFPSTKGINVGALLKGLGNTLKGGASGLAGSLRGLTFQAGNIARLTGLPHFVVLPMIVGAKIGASFRFDLAAIGRGIVAVGQGGWKGLVVTVRGDWKAATANASGAWGRIGAYTVVNLQRLGRFTVAALVPLNFAEMSVLGIGGAARLAFGERVLGIAQPDLHALLLNAGRVDAAVRGGSPLAHIPPGALVPVPPLAPPGVRFGANGLFGVPSPGVLFRPGAGAGFTVTADLVHLSLTKLPTVDLGSLGFGGLNGLRGLPGLGAHTGPGTVVPHGLGAAPVVGAVPTPGTGVHLPGGLTAPMPGTALQLPPVPHGMTTTPSGLSVPGGLSGAAHLVAQADLAGGQVRLDGNLLVNGNTAIDLLRDAHTPAPLAHTAPQTTVGVHPGAAGVSGVPVAGVGDGVSMARGAVGYAEDLDGLTFGELHALSLGDVSVTGIRADGISLRIGDAPVRTIDAHAIAATAPVGAAPVSHVPGTGAAQGLPGVVAGAGAAMHVGGGAVRAAGADAAHLVPGPAVRAPDVSAAYPVPGPATGVPGSGVAHAAPATGALPAPGTGAAHVPTPGTTPVHAPVRGSGTSVPHVNTGAKASSVGVPVPGRGTTPPPAPAAPVLNPQELALSLLRGDGPPPVATGVRGVRAENAGAVSARPALDTAGTAPRGAADAALDLVARPGRTGGPDLAAHVPAPAPHAPAPHPSAGDSAVPVPASAVPGPPPVRGPGGGGPASRIGGDGLSGPEPLPPTNRWGAQDAAITINRRFHAARQIVIGDTSGPLAAARLNGWASYEQAISRLGHAEKELQHFAPPGKPGAPSTVSPAHRKAWDAYARAEQVFDKAEDTLRGLGMDPAATLREIRSVFGRLMHERGPFALGGAPTPGRLAGHAPTPPPGAVEHSVDDLVDDIADDVMDLDLAAVPQGSTGHAPPAPRPGVADDAMDVDMDAGTGAHPPARSQDAVSAEGGGGAHLWTPPGHQGPRQPPHVLVNDAFRNGPPGRTSPPTGPLNEAQYLDFVRESVAESRPLGFVVNAIVHFDGLAGGGLQRFLNTVDAGLRGFDGRVAVVIGVNGPDAVRAALQTAMREAMEGARFSHPLALVHVPYNAKGNFKYGTVRNAVLDSAAGTHLARGMMENGFHPYFSIMDFDFHPHVVPDGRHVFQYFDETLRMPDEGAVRAAGGTPEPPLRPLMMAGGYRAPDLTAPGATDRLVEEINAKIVKEFSDAPAKIKAKDAEGSGKAKEPAGGSKGPEAKGGKGKGTKGGGKGKEPEPKTPPVITPDELPGLLQRIEHDMNTRTRLARIHPQLPYAPEPNLFVDAAATLLSRPGTAPVRFGDGAGEFATLSERLNRLNAWELDRRLPRPHDTLDGSRDLLGRAADSLRPGGPQLPAHELPAARDAIRRLADFLDSPGSHTGFNTHALRSFAEHLGTPPTSKGKELADARNPQLLDDALAALDDRPAQRAVAAGNTALPERGAAFVNDVRGAAVPTDVVRLVADVKLKGKLAQDHAENIKNPIDRLVGASDTQSNAQTARKNINAADHRDEWTGRPDNPLGNGATGVRTGQDPLFPNTHAPRPARLTDPTPGAHDAPVAPPPTRDAGDVASGLDSRLGTDVNTPGYAVSASVPGGDGLHAGITPDELRLSTRDMALANDRMTLLRHLRYLKAQHLAPGTQLPRPPGSLFDALGRPASVGEPPLDPQRLLNDVVDALDQRPSARTTTAKGMKDFAQKNFKPLLDRLGAEGIGVEDFFTRLSLGRVHPPSDTLQGFIASGERFAVDPGGFLVLERYAAALGRDIQVTGGDGVLHTVPATASGGGGANPLLLTWDHGHGWRVGDPAGPAPAGPAGSGPQGAGTGAHAGTSAGDGTGLDAPRPAKRPRDFDEADDADTSLPDPKRPRGSDEAGHSGTGSPPVPDERGAIPIAHQWRMAEAETEITRARGELEAAQHSLDLQTRDWRALNHRSASGAPELERPIRRVQDAQDALEQAEDRLSELRAEFPRLSTEGLPADHINHRINRLRPSDSLPPPAPPRPPHPPHGGTP
ncbi:putative T7SS-secreted protein [Streptomyces laurentii]|uniref:putative T7SS-secreted protein n=1 Tax=Streptomyces laurentii TaxID=39478 RepID=UPI0036AD80BB